MDIKSLFKLAKNKVFINNEGIFSPENIEDTFLHKINPKQVVNRMPMTPVMFYEVKYTYTTKRGNKKEGVKYFLENTYSPEKNMKNELEIWMKSFNNENPSRPLLNVKFLSQRCLGYLQL